MGVINKECSVDECPDNSVAKGMCDKHYRRFKRCGSTTLPLIEKSICSISDCPTIAKSRGWCSKHYDRWRVHGDPTIALRPWRKSPEERFWMYVEKTYTCWLWTGFVNSDGYGALGTKAGKTVGAHRFAYELIVEPISKGLQIDHLCRVRNCVNPDHLEVVTQQENVRRGSGPTALDARRTHCDNGHEFTPENTYIRTDGGRRCRKCQYESNKLISERDREVRLRAGLSLRKDTHCKKGHEYTPENTYMRPGAVRRRCKECMRERGEWHALELEYSS